MRRIVTWTALNCTLSTTIGEVDSGEKTRQRQTARTHSCLAAAASSSSREEARQALLCRRNAAPFLSFIVAYHRWTSTIIARSARPPAASIPSNADQVCAGARKQKGSRHRNAMNARPRRALNSPASATSQLYQSWHTVLPATYHAARFPIPDCPSSSVFQHRN